MAVRRTHASVRSAATATAFPLKLKYTGGEANRARKNAEAARDMVNFKSDGCVLQLPVKKTKIS